ncbi:MAG TPA: AzlD domain-containing protein, partial [Syntrophales bacterium]|nr:AzlD domain-containing protein [Syntrophales bacterium]HNZ35878.1 AzlD domain-containing protein [Syntrophales bacterium]HOH45313.1 AzlD domain-containing protein [Syntrophales bacterium]HOR33005.1 AzlD domain-containing protein [Syntrophales bacterium]HPK19419.1 AzlD domain-containing protein [Syntrophales bacterium]
YGLEPRFREDDNEAGKRVFHRMMTTDYFLLCLGMGLVTYVPRWAPLVALSQRSLPRWLEEWLDLIPAAILSALILPALVTAGEPRQLSLWNNDLLVAGPVFLFALRTRSLGGTVVVGMALYWLAGNVLG